MECPFCNETIKDEALACKNCSRDLRFIRPTLMEIQDLVHELDALAHRVDRARMRLARLSHPWRYFLTHFTGYVLAPAALLVATHICVTILFDASPLYLRITSIVLPLLFGIVSVPLSKLQPIEAAVAGLITAVLAVGCMLSVTGVNDNVPIMPTSLREWREAGEYAASISLAMVSGNILGTLVFRILPSTLAQGGKPNAVAIKTARLLGDHVGHEQLRRRARLIQELVQTVGPLAGAAAGVAGSLYTGLKGVLGS